MIWTIPKKQRGYLLVELLTALTLFSVAGSSLYSGFIEGVHCHKRIEESNKTFSGPKLLFLRFEEDLRNMVPLKDYPFKGTAGEITFPALLAEDAAGKGTRFRLVQVRYFIHETELIREEEELSTKLNKAKAKEKTVLRNVEKLTFRFPVKGETGGIHFQDFWLEDPYPGLPRAVQVNLKTEGLAAVKTVSIPQGLFAQTEESTQPEDAKDEASPV